MIQCGECKKDFTTAVGLAIHVGRLHKDVHVCPHCGKYYGSKTYAEDAVTYRKFLACIESHGHERENELEAKQA
jgi:hypothetical protein